MNPYIYIHLWQHKCTSTAGQHTQGTFQTLSWNLAGWLALSMSDPSDVLVKQSAWAAAALNNHHVWGKHGEAASLLWSQKTIGTGSMFSGIGCAERALASINAARKPLCEGKILSAA